jgi:D-alanyl-D-alanine carboxypeptidase
MQTTVAVPGAPAGTGAGLGIFASRTPCGRVWGHDGLFPGYKSTAWTTAGGRRVVVVLLNDSWLPEGATRILRGVLTSALCR